MDTNLQPRVIFLYSLPNSVAEPMRLKGVDYNSVIKMIGDYDGVEVSDLNRDFFSKRYKCNILIILGEFLEDKNALLLQDDSIFPIADLVNLVSRSFREVNVIDCAWCYSGKGKTHNELKQRTHALVNTINGYTAAETRLALYWLLLKENKLLGRDNYKDSYDKKLSDLGVYQDSMNSKQLASLSEGTNLGTMATGEQPFEVKRNSRFYIRVIFHDESEEEIKRDNIKDAWNIPYRIKKPILKELKDGDTVHLDLRFDTDNPEMTKFLHGGGEYSFLFIKDAENIGRYECFVEAGFREEIIHGTLKIKINDNPYYVDEWFFSIKVKRPENDLALDGNNNELPSNRLHNNNRSPFKFTAIPKYPVPHTSKEEVTDNRESDKYIQATRLPAKLYRVQAEYLFKSLKEKERFLGTDSTLDSWLHIMGCQMTQMWKPIRWINTKENLRILLNGIYEKEIDDKIYTKKFLSEKVELCFIDSKGNAMKLAKPKTEESTDKDIILQLISDLKKSDL